MILSRVVRPDMSSLGSSIYCLLTGCWVSASGVRSISLMWTAGCLTVQEHARVLVQSGDEVRSRHVLYPLAIPASALPRTVALCQIHFAPGAGARNSCRDNGPANLRTQPRGHCQLEST